MKIKIKNNLFFNTQKKPLIIAEISGNHSQSKKKFLDLIVKSHENGADLGKIQTQKLDNTINCNAHLHGFELFC